MLGRFFGRRRDTQGDDPNELAREDEPRGGLQSERYRRADPRDLVDEGGVVMSAPGGSPQEGEPVEERRERDPSESAPS